MVTQDQIARELNLSKSTVSRILSGKSFFEDETRARVLTLASKLGYRHLRPTVRHYSKRNVKLTVIGVAIEESISPAADSVVPVVASRTLRGISEAARMEEVAIHVNYFSRKETSQLHLPEHQPTMWRKGHLSGLLLHGNMNITAIKELSNQLPCVRVNDREPEIAVDCVGQNDLDGSEALVMHLHSLGHSRMGFCSEGIDHWPYQARLAGYWLANMRLGLDPRNSSTVMNNKALTTSPDRWGEVGDSILELVNQGVRAWICVHDDLGYKLVRFFQLHKIAVPQDVVVCGFDNLKPQEKDLPRLTTIDWPFEDIGAAALRRLLRRLIEPGCTQVYTMFEGRLIPRSSTMPGLVDPVASEAGQTEVKLPSNSPLGEAV